MKVLRWTLLIILIVGCFEVFRCVEVLGSGSDLCKYFKDGVQLRQPGTCSTGMTCKDFKSVENTVVCTGTTGTYDRNTMVCAATTTDTYCTSPCVAKSNTYVVDPKNCKGWYQCNGATTISSGYCTSNLLFNATNQMCDYPENSSCQATYTICNLVPDGVPFQYEDDYCDTYRECGATSAKNKASIEYTKTCETGKFFDIYTGTCIAKAAASCVNYPLPDGVCGNAKVALRNRFVADGSTCRGYFYCKDQGVGKPDTSPTWGQCPVTTFFESKEVACMPRTYVKCAEDRCDGRKDGYELSETTGCKHYIECSNGVTVEERYCGDDMWFDADTEKCTTTLKTYSACS